MTSTILGPSSTPNVLHDITKKPVNASSRCAHNDVAVEHRVESTITDFDDLGSEASVDNVQATENKVQTRESFSVLQNSSVCQERLSGSTCNQERVESVGSAGHAVRRSLSKEFDSHIVNGKENGVPNTVSFSSTAPGMVQGMECRQMSSMVIVYSIKNIEHILRVCMQ